MVVYCNTEYAMHSTPMVVGTFLGQMKLDGKKFLNESEIETDMAQLHKWPATATSKR